MFLALLSVFLILDGLFRSASHIFLLRLNMNHEIKTTNLFFLGDLSLVFSFILFPWDSFKTFSILCLLSIHIFLGFLSMTPFKAFKTEQILFLFHTHTHTKFFGSLWRCSLSSDLARTRRISRKILFYTGKLTKKQFNFNTQSWSFH